MRRSAAKVIDDALTKAHFIFGRYLVPGKREAEKTVNDLFAVLDDEEFIKAWAELQEEAFSSRHQGAGDVGIASSSLRAIA